MTSGLTRPNAARDAIKNLQEADPDGLSKALAFCLMFDEPRTQFVCATMLELLIQLETALRLPTESLLAAIRVQWWVDTVLTPVDPTIAPPAPLIGQMHRLIKDTPQLEDAVPHLMAFWQTACHDSDRDSRAGWGASFEILARVTGQAKAASPGRPMPPTWPPRWPPAFIMPAIIYPPLWCRCPIFGRYSNPAKNLVIAGCICQRCWHGILIRPIVMRRILGLSGG